MRMVVSSSLRFRHLDEVTHLEHHAPNLGRVVVLDHVLQLAQTQSPHRVALILLVAARALHPADAKLTRHQPLSSRRTSLPPCARAPRPPRPAGAGDAARPPWP